MNRDDDVNSHYQYHTACLSCDSSDGMAVYANDPEEGDPYTTAYCWVCETYFGKDDIDEDNQPVKENRVTESKRLDPEFKKYVLELASGGSKIRKIRKEFMEIYGIKMSRKPDGGVEKHYYPLTKNNEITGYKVRTLPKDFTAVGDTKKTQLFGQSVFETGKVQTSNKFLCITEGELDAVALQQVLSDKGNPNFKNAVVSIPSGSSSAVKSVQENWKWVNTFEQVVLFFDNDEPGQKAAIDVARKLPLGKVKIAKTSEKDPCDMLKKGKEDELYNAFWKADLFAPDGVLAGSGLWNLVTTPMSESSATYPWRGLNKMLHGIRTSEMVTLTAGSGVAKSTFARMIAHHLQKTTDHNIGMIFLEESVKKTSLQIMSLEAGKQLHMPETEYTDDELRDAFDKTLGTERYFFYDDFASQDFDGITESIIYMARAMNCKYIFLDHISMLVSGQTGGDERKALDAICTKLRSLVQQLDIALFIVTHLKRPQGIPHEEGGSTSLAQLRGSAGIAQLSDAVIGFERNSQAEDDMERNTTHVRILKNRYSGECSLACSLLYDHGTGWVRELSDSEVEDMDTDSSEFEDAMDFDDPKMDNKQPESFKDF